MSVRIRYMGKPILEQVIARGRSLRSVVEKDLKPNKYVFELIGEELVRGFRGDNRASNIKFPPNGMKPTVTYASRYPYGIKQQKSPNGAPYRDLKKSTIALKKRDDRPDGLARSTTPEKALLDQHELVNGLTYRVYAHNDGVEAHFISAELADKSLRQERGGNFVSRAFSQNNKGGGESVEKRRIPYSAPIPHRGIQNQVRDTITRILKAWANKDGA